MVANLSYHQKSLKGKFFPFEFHPIFLINACYILGISWYASSWSLLSLRIGIGAATLMVLVITRLSLVRLTTSALRRIVYFFIIACLSFTAGATLYRQQLERQNIFEQALLSRRSFKAYVERISVVDTQQFCHKTVLLLEKEKGRLLVFSRARPLCEIGDYVLVKNLSIAPIKNQKFRHFLLKENILGSHYTTFLRVKVLHHPRFNFMRLCEHIRVHLKERLQTKMSPAGFDLWQTIFLGDKAGKTTMQDMKAACKNWGISHYIARSGLHLMLFIFLWVTFFKLIPISFIFKQILLLMLVLLYSFLSTPSVSFIRALLTFLLYKFCMVQHLEIRPLHIVNLACLITLVWSPAQLFYLDFQLSYALTAAITLFYELNHYKKFLIQNS